MASSILDSIALRSLRRPALCEDRLLFVSDTNMCVSKLLARRKIDTDFALRDEAVE